MPSYNFALSSEPELQIQVEKILEILSALNKKILKENDSEGDKMVDAQETIKDTGLLDLLLKLAQLISQRLEEKNEESFTYKIPNTNVKNCGKIGEKYLSLLIKKLYNTIYFCIKNNPRNCEVLKNYDEFLSFHLSFYKSEVSMLLKETFKHSVDIMNKISIKQFGIWVEQITVINESKGDIVDQTLILMILASFCVHKNKGLMKYQSLIEGHLFSYSFKFKLLDFFTFEDKEYINFLPGELSYEEFLNSNPTLEGLYTKFVINPATFTKFIEMSSLNTDKRLIKYVAAFLDLLSNLCISRYESAKPKIQETFNLTPYTILECLTSPSLHLKLRISFMKLARVMYLDIDPIIPITKSRDRCYFWNLERMEIEEKKEEFSNFKSVNFSIAALGNWLKKAWTDSDFPAINSKNYSNECKIKFTTELLNLTQTTINLGYFDLSFFIDIYPSLIKLISDYSESSIIKQIFHHH